MSADTDTVYAAGPLGFSEPGRFFHYEKLIPAIEEAGYTVLDPWSLTPEEKIEQVTNLPYGKERRDAWRDLNEDIGRNNREAIEEADYVVAVLDGADVDSGTAAEIGYAAAHDTPIIGYRSDFRTSGDNEGATVNLQIEHFIDESGGTIVEDLETLREHLEAL